MKERPIIFNAPMVRAILEGRKTQTRRVVKPQPFYPVIVAGDPETQRFCVENHEPMRLEAFLRFCPYGQPGDRLWVRENWRIGAWDENNGRFALDYCDGPDKRWITVPESTDDYLGEGVFEHYWMQCSDELSKKGILPDSDGQYHWEHGESPLRWRPAIHMPRWASRITLEVTGMRAERLQDISEDDAIAEGLKCITKDGAIYKYGIPDADGLPGKDDFGWPWMEWNASPVLAYKKLWEQINGPGSWEKNPWVWVVEFKRVEWK